MDTRERSAWSQAVAEQIRAERGIANLTKSEVSRRSGIPWSTYYKVDKGSSAADITQIARICEALGIPLVKFIEDVQARVDAAMRDDPERSG